MVSVALRADPVPLALAVTVTELVPEPLAPLVMLSQEDDSDAVQVHPAVVVTVMAALPPLGAIAEFAGTVNVQGAASCVTAMV